MIDAIALAEVSLLEGLDARALDAVGAVMREVEFRAHETILAQGERTGGAYLLLDGDVLVQRMLPDGSSIDLVTLSPGAMFGALSVIDAGSRAASCIATTAVRCAELSRVDFLDLMNGHTGAALAFQLAVTRELFKDMRATNARLAELATLPEHRITREGLRGLLRSER